METEHTPGKWQIERGFIKQERKDGQKVVRIVAPHPEGGGQDIAECLECNSQLIVSAPEMLETFRKLRAIIVSRKTDEAAIMECYPIINEQIARAQTGKQ